MAGAQSEPNIWSFKDSVLVNHNPLLQWTLDAVGHKHNMGAVWWKLFAQDPCWKHADVEIWQNSSALRKRNTVEISVCTHCIIWLSWDSICFHIGFILSAFRVHILLPSLSGFFFPTLLMSHLQFLWKYNVQNTLPVTVVFSWPNL